MENIISTLTIVVPILGIIIGWWLSERSKRKHEEYMRKEDRYTKLIESLRGFHVGSENDRLNKGLKERFLLQLNLSWMYCSDEVIRKAYAFLGTIHTGNEYSDKDREKALGEFIVAIRKDLADRKLLRKTELKPEDFKILKAT